MRNLNITAQELTEIEENGFQLLSDIDFGFNKETQKFDIPSVEVDGCYGRHWIRFVSEEARQAWLDEYDKNLNKAVIELRVRKEKEVKAKKAAKRAERFNNSFGGTFSQLAELKERMAGQ